MSARCTKEFSIVVSGGCPITNTSPLPDGERGTGASLFSVQFTQTGFVGAEYWWIESWGGPGGVFGASFEDTSSGLLIGFLNSEAGTYDLVIGVSPAATPQVGGCTKTFSLTVIDLDHGMFSDTEWTFPTAVWSANDPGGPGHFVEGTGTGADIVLVSNRPAPETFIDSMEVTAQGTLVYTGPAMNCKMQVSVESTGTQGILFGNATILVNGNSVANLDMLNNGDPWASPSTFEVNFAVPVSINALIEISIPFRHQTAGFNAQWAVHFLGTPV